MSRPERATAMSDATRSGGEQWLPRACVSAAPVYGKYATKALVQLSAHVALAGPSQRYPWQSTAYLSWLWANAEPVSQQLN